MQVRVSRRPLEGRPLPYIGSSSAYPTPASQRCRFGLTSNRLSPRSHSSEHLLGPRGPLTAVLRLANRDAGPLTTHE